MAKRGKRAAKTTAPPTKREVDDFFRILKKYGLEELTRCHDRYQKSKRKRGRPRYAFDKDFLDSAVQFFGDYWTTDRKRAIADWKARGIERPRGGWWFPTPYHTLLEFARLAFQTENYKNKALPPDVLEAWHPRHLGTTPEHFARRLLKQLPKKFKTRKAMRKRERVKKNTARIYVHRP
jgi:hypothetical protein